METITKWIGILRQPEVWITGLVVIGIWLALHLICWVLGALGLSRRGSKAEIKPAITAKIPGGQIWYTLMLSEKQGDAKWAERLLWWWPTAAFAGFVSALWALVFQFRGAEILPALLLIFAVLLVLAAIGLYVWLRVLEFRALSGLLPNKTEWIVSLVCTVLGLPVQRILLFAHRK